jgi:hypothetical protein
MPRTGCLTLTRARSGGHLDDEANRIMSSRRGDATMQRKIFPAYGGYNVAVASEQMKDGKWAAVATITHSTGTGQRIIDLPVPNQRFETEEQAEGSAVKTALEWIDRNTPSEDSRGPSKVA